MERQPGLGSRVPGRTVWDNGLRAAEEKGSGQPLRSLASGPRGWEEDRDNGVQSPARGP